MARTRTTEAKPTPSKARPKKGTASAAVPSGPRALLTPSLDDKDPVEGEIVDDEAEADAPGESSSSPGAIVDVDSEALVVAPAVVLPQGEWMREPKLDDDELPRSSGLDDAYDAFVREATRLSRLSDDDERALGRKVRDQGDTLAAKKLVVHNLRLAIKMAHQYRRSWTNLMDLVQEASAGMAIAAQRWDPDQGTRFGTYAVYWMRAQLTKFIMTNGRAIHTGNTRAGRKLYFQLPRIRRKLLAEGKEASVENIAKEAQEPAQEVARVIARLDGREASLDAPVGDDDGGPLSEVIAGDDDGPEKTAAQQEMAKLMEHIVSSFFDTLTEERDRAIWREHLVAAEPTSLVELGARYGVSKQRMGQVATRLKRAFRRHVIDSLGPHTQLHWLFANE